MKTSALLVARTILVVALFPLLAGCAAEQEPLQRGDRGADAESVRAEPGWADPADATLTPGMPIHTEAGDCPTSFFFQSAASGILFVSTTAYCVRDLPVGAVGTFGPNDDIAVLIYSSFITMAEIGEKNADAMQYNDLAVFYLDPRTTMIANPALPGGGPTALANTRDYDVGDRLRSLARGGPAQDDWRESVVAARTGDWAFQTYTLLPAAPGTLGGPVLDAEGRAVGILASLGVFPNPGMNTVVRLDSMLEYARVHAKVQMELGTWELSNSIPSRES